MAVKFPLEVKNGVKARNISEMKENFDVEKVVGYFLDGRLKSWLESRYYEEEAEAVDGLDENDVALAKKLCEIFDVEYEMEEINNEEIARRNERLAKLKQFTADYDVINNIDVVAFNQEELADLYNKGVTKIYLCEGPFTIPKTKKELEYVEVGSVIVNGLTKEINVLQDLAITEKVEEPKIPKEIGDKINVNKYINLRDYLIYQDGGTTFYKYNKKTGKEEPLYIPKDYTKTVFSDAFYAYENPFIYPYNYLGNNKQIVCDIEQNEYKEVDLKPFLACPFVSEGKFAYFDKDEIKTYNIKTGEIATCIEELYENVESMILFKNDIYMYYLKENCELLCFEAGNQMKKHTLFSYGKDKCKLACGKFHVYNDDLYLVQHQYFAKSKPDEYGLIISKVEIKNGEYKCNEILNLLRENIDCSPGLYCVENSRYIPFIKLNEDYSLYLIDLETNEVKRIATGCGFHGRNGYGEHEFGNIHQLVQNYIYFEKGEEKMLHRVNLSTKKELPVK